MDKLKQIERDIIELVRDGCQTSLELINYIVVSHTTLNFYLRNLVKEGYLIQTSIKPRGKSYHNIYELSTKLRGITIKYDVSQDN